jgi:short subunit fatty acids transporter
MQIILIVITGFAIALSPIVNKGIGKLTNYINTPRQVYFAVALIGALLSLISFGWIVITCVLARELAIRIKGVNYPFLVACVYFCSGSWVTGLSSSIPLLLGTENNYLIEAVVLSDIITTAVTLGSGLNFAMMALYILFAPVMTIKIICIPNSNKDQKPSYQPLIISMGLVPNQIKAISPVIRVRSIANTKALGIYFSNTFVAISPNLVNMVGWYRMVSVLLKFKKCHHLHLL